MAALVRIQALSGMAFAVFLSLHLANTVSAMFGQAAYDGLQRLLRWYYQFPPVEIACVVGAALVHVSAGIARMKLRPRKAPGATIPWRVRLHRWSGYVLMLLFAGHVTATRGPGLLLGVPADFSYLTFSLGYWPLFFYPYYLVLFASGAWHLLNGVSTAAAVLAPGVRLSPAWAPVGAGVAVVCGLMGILALGGNLFEVDTHRYAEFRALADRFYPEWLRPWAVPP